MKGGTVDPLTRAQLAEILGRTPADDEPVETLIVEALHVLWHAAPQGRGWDRTCTAKDADAQA